MDIEKYLQDLKQDMGQLLGQEIKLFINDVEKDSTAWIQEQTELVKKYLKQLALGKITIYQFKGYMIDIKDITEMKLLKLSANEKIKAQKLANGIKDLLIKKLGDLIS
ncbi:hypothetical protein ACFL4S_01080 [bacterium]